MAGHKNYTPQERAALLAMFVASGKSQRAFSREKGVNPKTFAAWVNGSPPVKQAIKAQEERRLDALYEDEIHGALSVMPGKRDDASYRDLAIVVGILDDKVTRRQGEPTERIAHEGAEGGPLEIRYVNDWRRSPALPAPRAAACPCDGTPVQLADGWPPVAENDAVHDDRGNGHGGGA